MKYLGLFLVTILIVPSSSFARRMSIQLYPQYNIRVETRGFSQREDSTIERALNILGSRVATIVSDRKRRGGHGNFERCVAEHSTKDFFRANPRIGEYENKLENAFHAFLFYSLALARHEKERRPIYIDAFYEDSRTWGRVPRIGRYPLNRDPEYADFTLNRRNLQAYPDATDHWAGTMFHEILHRVGFRHPTGYPGSLIKEAGICLARNFQRAQGLGLAQEFGYQIED